MKGREINNEEYSLDLSELGKEDDVKPVLLASTNGRRERHNCASVFFSVDEARVRYMERR